MKFSTIVFIIILVLGCKAEQASVRQESVRPREVHEHAVLNEERQGGKGLSLFLHIAQKTFSIGDPIKAVFSIENHDDAYWAFFPVFAPEGQSPEDYPLAELSFLIRHEAGSYIPWDGQYEGLREPPSLCSAEILMPSAFCGSHISLTQGKFSYALREPGLYKIKARLRLYQTPWVKRHLQLLRVEPTELPYDLSRIFDGTIESNEEEIELKLR